MHSILVTHMGTTLGRYRVAMVGAEGAVRACIRLADAVMRIARVHLASWRGTTSTTRARLRGRYGRGRCVRAHVQTTAHTLKKPNRQIPTAVRDATEEAQAKPRESRECEAETDGGRSISKHAERLTSKLDFYNTAVFGYLGRAALRPLYFRDHANGCPEGAPLTKAISAASNSIEFSLNFAPPRIIPFAVRDRRKHARTPARSPRKAAR
jgi:hypothetical protein